MATERLEKVVIWLHGDHLSAANPALLRYPDAPVIFVFDEAFLLQTQFGFKRLLFIYESVMDVFAARPDGTCRVQRGAVVADVQAFARENGATRIVTTQTLGDSFREYVGELEAGGLPVEAHPVAELVPYPDARRAPKRFSAWWREVEDAAMAP